MKQNKSIQTS